MILEFHNSFQRPDFIQLPSVNKLSLELYIENAIFCAYISFDIYPEHLMSTSSLPVNIK